jgi:serine/threonine kinase 16
MFVKSLLRPSIEIDGAKLSILEQIGEGGFAYIYKAKYVTPTTSHSTVALKKMICQTEEQLTEAQKEIEVLTTVRHENVINLITHTIRDNKNRQHEVWLVLPLYEKSLQNIIDSGFGYPNCSISQDSVMAILLATVRGLEAIHNCRYRHCDFKPANILLDRGMHAVITDMGSASHLVTLVETRAQALNVQDYASVHTTASFRSPELFDTPSHCVIDGKADVWSFGCLCYALLYSRTPFENPVHGLSSLAVMSANYSIPDCAHKWSPAFEAIIRGCLTVNCDERLSISKLVHLVSLLPEGETETVVDGVGEGHAETAGDDDDDFGDFVMATTASADSGTATQDNFEITSKCDCVYQCDIQLISMTVASPETPSTPPKMHQGIEAEQSKSQTADKSDESAAPIMQPGTVLHQGPVFVMRKRRVGLVSSKLVRKEVSYFP